MVSATETELRNRLRKTAQVLINEIGVTGPTDAEDVALSAVNVIRKLKADLEFHRQDIRAVCNELSIAETPEPGSDFAKAIRLARHWDELANQRQLVIDEQQQKIQHLCKCLDEKDDRLNRTKEKLWRFESDLEDAKGKFGFKENPEPGTEFARAIQHAYHWLGRAAKFEEELAAAARVLGYEEGETTIQDIVDAAKKAWKVIGEREDEIRQLREDLATFESDSETSDTAMEARRLQSELKTVSRILNDSLFPEDNLDPIAAAKEIVVRLGRHRDAVKDYIAKAEEVKRLEEKVAKFEEDAEGNSFEFRIDPAPEPGSDMAKLLEAAKSARLRAADMETENLKLLREIDEWKTASGLEKGGDPDGVTPRDLWDYLQSQRATTWQRDSFYRQAERYSYASVAAICAVVATELENAIEVQPDNAIRAEGAYACMDAVCGITPIEWPGHPIKWIESDHGDQIFTLVASPDHPRKPFLGLEIRRSMTSNKPFACVALDLGNNEGTVCEFDVPFIDGFAYGPCPRCSSREGHECPACLGTGQNIVGHAAELAKWVYYQWLVQDNLKNYMELRG